MLDFIDYSNQTTTYIDKKSILIGDIETNGVLEIKGQLDGNCDIHGLCSVYGIVNGKIQSIDFIGRSFCNVFGPVNATNDTYLETNSIIKGDISANNVEIYGRVDGNIVANKTIFVREGGIINGDVSCRTLVVDEGAKVNGFVKLTYDYLEEMI